MSTVMITGVNRGLGLEFVKQYLAAGWQVIGTCRDPAAAGELRSLAEGSDALQVYPLDVSDSSAVEALAAQLSATAIDLLILNAGVMGQASLKLGELQAEDFQQVLTVNVVAPAICIQAFKNHVAASDRKQIVGIGSILGSVASNENGGLYGYRSSKAGLNAVLRSASLDLRDAGITVVSFHPGWVATDMGGKDAHINPGESIEGMRRVIESLSIADSGRFLTYAGEELPW